MREYLNRSRLPALAILSLLTVVTTSTEAFASLPGESPYYNAEIVGGEQLAANGSLSEARDDHGNLLEVWRGANNNRVWMSFNNGTPFTLGNTATYVSPTVVPFGGSAFLVFHTGTDGGIYYTAYYNDRTWGGEWIDVPGQTTNMPVSVTQMGGTDSLNVYMVYRGSGADNRIFGTWFDGRWHDPTNIGGGYALSAPTITYNPAIEVLYAVAEGEDGQVWWTVQRLGASSWPLWQPAGVYTIASPNIRSNPDGTMVLDYLGTDNRAHFEVTNAYLESEIGWSTDSTNWQSYYPVNLTTVGDTFYALLTGYDGLVYYKHLYN
jgi:hypothetical protein